MENWNIPLLEIGDLKIKLIQGGMGVGISRKKLAAAVAREGGMGVIASVGLNECRGYSGNYVESSKRALRDEIREARSETSGAIGVNIMYALSNFKELAITALEENVEAIISGAGFSRTFPTFFKETGNTHTKLIPMANSAEQVNMMFRAWDRYERAPDAIIVEGPKAGGHLAYKYEDLTNPKFVARGLERIIPEVVAEVKTHEIELRRKIPVIAAGGIFYGGDIRKFLDKNMAASGVQMATRFVTTDECDASPEFKQAYLDSKPEEIIIIRSPVKMPGRAIKNKFLEEVAAGKRTPINCPYHCLKTCEPENSPYCIARALTEAKAGKFDNGFVFCGLNAPLCKEIVPVHRVFEMLNQEYQDGKVSA